MNEWKWRVRCTYNDTVSWPKVPGELAIETVHLDDVSKDLEVEVSKKRGDVDVVVTEYVSPLGNYVNRPLTSADLASIKEANEWWQEIFRDKSLD